MHEGGIATPMIARWPKGIPAGSMTDQVGHIVDFMPTFLDMAGAKYPEQHKEKKIIPAEGISLLASLKEPKNAFAREKPLFWAFAGSRAVREGDWKLAWDARIKAWELYDLKTDRSETNNLAEEFPERVIAMARDWEAWLAEVENRR